jgi:hypothetical protein
LTTAEAWRLRGRTLRAMILLCRAKLLIACVPLYIWRRSLGFEPPAGSLSPVEPARREARRLAVHVVRAAARLPFEVKCLPQAMALSTLLRTVRTAHTLVIVARPSAAAASGDRLHAWIDLAGERVIGDLPGPWIEVLHLGVQPGGPDCTDPGPGNATASAKNPPDGCTIHTDR